MKIRIIKKKSLDEISSVAGGANGNVEGHVNPDKKKAEEMCKDTKHSKKIDEMYSTSGAMMGSGSGEIPKERNPEAHKRYVRIRFTRQGLQNFKPSPYFRDSEQQLGEKWSKRERKKRKSKCSNPKGFTMKQFCKNQKTRSKKREKKN